MIIIFSASSDRMSFPRTSRIIGPVVRWLFPHVTDHTVNSVVYLIRKCAHLSEYALLACLCWLAVNSKQANSGWSWRVARNVLFVVALYACTDEFHQTFVPSREGSVWDVLLDTTGGAFGLLFVWIVGRWRKLW